MDLETRFVLFLRRKGWWKRVYSRTRRWESRRTNDHFTVLSYPKSGRSWVRFMLCHVESALTGRPLERYLHGIADRKTKEPRFYFVHGVSPHEDLNDYNYDRAFSSHPPGGVIFLVRDPVKVIASFYNHLKSKRFFGITLGAKTTFADFIADPRLGVARYEAYIDFYINRFARSSVPFLVVRYEDVLNAPKQELKRILEFSNTELSDQSLRDIVEKCSFENMRAIEENRDVQVYWLSPGKRGDRSSYKTRGAFKKARYAEYGEPEQKLMERFLSGSTAFKALGYESKGVRPQAEVDLNNLSRKEPV